MASPVTAISTPLSVTTTKGTVFTLKAAQRCKISNLSLFGDANAVLYGTFSIRVKGRTITNPAEIGGNGSITLISTLSGFSADWQPPNEIVLERGETIEVDAVVSTGTANVQVMAVGVVDPEG